MDSMQKYPGKSSRKDVQNRRIHAHILWYIRPLHRMLFFGPKVTVSRNGDTDTRSFAHGFRADILTLRVCRYPGNTLVVRRDLIVRGHRLE